MEWYFAVVKNYAGFSGRARRREYWIFALINLIIGILLTGVGRALGTSVLSTIYSLAVLIPGLAVGARRLHDTNRSGWLLLLGLIPFIGWLVLIIFLVQDGTRGDNRFGPDPKAAPVLAAPTV